MQEYTIKRTQEGYYLGYTDIVGKASSFKEFVEQNKKSLMFANLRHANLSNANLSNASLSNARLYNARLEHTNLENARLYNANLKNTNLENANLEGANLENTRLYNTRLYNTRLYNTDFSNARLYNANLENANIFNASLYTYKFLKTDEKFINCFLAISCKTRTIKDWNTFFYNSNEVIETKRDTDRFIQITKEYEEVIKIFKIRFDNRELK